MILWILWFSALAWTSRCEPPVNSYLPPNGSNGRPSSLYGPPGNQPGFEGLGNQNQPGFKGNGYQNQQGIGSHNQDSQDSYLAPGQRPQINVDTQYGPPSRQNGRGFDSQSGFGSKQQGFTQGNRNVPSSVYGTPGLGGKQASREGSQNRPPFGGSSRGQSGGSQSTYDNNLRGGSPSNGLGSTDFRKTPESSYGPPPVGGVQIPDNNLRSQGSTPSNSFGSQGQRPGTFQDSLYGPPSFSSAEGLGSRRQDGQGGSPSASYGTPNFDSGSSRLQSGRSESNFNEGESDEPAKYEFSYDVDDFQTGTKFGHKEQRDGDTATGEYNVVLPDGRKQVVEYEAGLQGFKPQIRYEGGSGGTDTGFGGANAGRQGVSQGYPREGPGSSYSGSDNRLGPSQELKGPLGLEQYQGAGSLEQGAQSSLGRKGTGDYPNDDSSGRRSQGGNFSGYPDGRPRKEQGYSSGRVEGNGVESLNGGNSGYPRGGPEGNSGSSRGRPGQNTGFQGRQSGNSFGSFDQGDNMGYPSGGPSGGRGFQDRFGSSYNDGSDGYRSGGTQGGQGFLGGISQGSDSGYPSGRPQSGNDFSRSRNPQSEGFENGQRGNVDGYPRGGSQGGQGSFGGQTGKDRDQQGGEVGYPSGGPNGPRGSGY